MCSIPRVGYFTVNIYVNVAKRNLGTSLVHFIAQLGLFPLFYLQKNYCIISSEEYVLAGTDFNRPNPICTYHN